MARKTVRVDWPKDPEDLMKLIGKVVAKSEALGADSPLKNMDIPALKAKNEAAVVAQDSYDDFSAKAKTQMGVRNNALGTRQTQGTGSQLLAQARDILLANNPDNPRVLDEWGFTVVEGEAVRSSETPTKSV